MTQVLHLSTSIFGENGKSSQLATTFVDRLQARDAGISVARRDLSADAVPHLSGVAFQAFTTPAEERTPEQQQLTALSDALVEELQRSDVIVLGLPMYNFGIPSTLKAWIDHVARAGLTFQYTANGPQGLLTGKKLYVFASRGGQYLGTPLDTQSQYIRDFFGFLGIRDVEFVYAENLARPVLQDEILEAANEDITALAI